MIAVRPFRKLATRGWLAAGLAGAVLAVSACGSQPAEEPEPAPTTGDPGSPASESPSATPTPTPSLAQADMAELEEVTEQMEGEAGVAIVPVGSEEVLRAGDWHNGLAWSTIKVPISLAAEEAEVSGFESLAEPAITYSDNASARDLYESLGSSSEAIEAVEEVLSERGTNAEVMDSFGTTEWHLQDQATFMAAMACEDADSATLGLMAQIDPELQWGLSEAGDQVAFKGGWGNNDDGTSLTRQMGLITTDEGQFAVAIAVDGVAEQPAEEAMNELGAAVGETIESVPSPGCSS